MKQIGAKTVTEQVPVVWDFSDDIDGSLTSATFTKSTIVGNDPGAASLGIGVPVLAGGFVTAVLSGGGENCSYQITCTVVDTSARVYQLAVRTTATQDAA